MSACRNATCQGARLAFKDSILVNTLGFQPQLQAQGYTNISHWQHVQPRATFDPKRFQHAVVNTVNKQRAGRHDQDLDISFTLLSDLQAPTSH